MFRNQRHKNKCLEGHLVLLFYCLWLKVGHPGDPIIYWAAFLQAAVNLCLGVPNCWNLLPTSLPEVSGTTPWTQHIATAKQHLSPQKKHERNERGQISPKRNLSQVRAIPVPGPAKKHVGSQQPKNMYGTKRGTITMRFITLQAKLTKTSQNHGCDAHKSQDIKMY